MRYYLVMGSGRVHGWFSTPQKADVTAKTAYDLCWDGHVGMVIAAAPNRAEALRKAEECWTGRMRLAEARRG